MSANFLNTSGGCLGLDYHMYFVLALPEPLPFPVPDAPHVVGPNHDEPSRDWRIANTVTTDAKPTLQTGWAMILVNHLPFPPPGPPHLAEFVMLDVLRIASSAQPPLAVHGVTGQGQKLLTEIYGSFGLNVDCSDLPTIGLSVDHNVNSVKTSPTLGDFIAAILGAAGRMLFGWLLGKLAGKLGGKLLRELEKEVRKIVANMLARLSSAVLRNILNWLASFAYPWADPIAWVFNQIARRLQGLVDPPSPLLQ